MKVGRLRTQVHCDGLTNDFARNQEESYLVKIMYRWTLLR